ncbi:hypothetical protein D3C87_1870640 [compost metagenome]
MLRAFRSPGCAGVKQINALFTQLPGAHDGFFIMGIPSVDDDIACFKQPGKDINNSCYDLSGRNHDPENSGMLQLRDHILQG